MDFQVSHVIRNTTCAEFRTLFFDEELSAAVCQGLQLDRRLVNREDANGVHTRVVEVVSRRQIPSWILKVVGERSLSYTETMVHTPETGQGNWEIVPKMFASQVTCKGTVSFSEHPHGVQRHVAGTVSVRLRGAGSLVERFVISEIEKTFAQAAQLTEAWLSRHSQTSASTQA